MVRVAYGRSFLGIVAVVLAVVLPTRSQQPDTNAAQAEAKKLRGYWTMTALEIDGKAVEEARLQGTTLEIRGDKYIVTTGRKPREVRFVLDPTKNPKEIDLLFPDPPNADQVHRGIYRVEEDTLQVCKAQAASQPRPTEFKTKPSSGVFIVTWKRQE